MAEGGTLFIDEIGEMAPGLQAKLLRVLEDGHYRRVGGTQETHADVRVVAATNKPLEEELKAGRFREDLYYRLNVVTIELPPLRERRQDIPELVEHFLTTRQVGPARSGSTPDAAAGAGALRLARQRPRAGQRAGARPDPGRGPRHHAGRPARRPGRWRAARPRSRTSRATCAKSSGGTSWTSCSEEKGNKVQAARALGISRRALYRLTRKIPAWSSSPRVRAIRRPYFARRKRSEDGEMIEGTDERSPTTKR